MAISGTAISKPDLVALSLLNVEEEKLAAIAMNMAGSSVSGFRSLIFQTEAVPYTDPTSDEVIYVKTGSVLYNQEDGAKRKTDNPFDLAIKGSAYFRVMTPNGVRYTRNGQFQLDPDGRIVNMNGQLVQSADGGEITIPLDTTQISISGNGTILTEDRVLGRIGTFDMVDPKTMTSEGLGLYNTTAEVTPSQSSQVLQGFLEESNGNAISQVLDMVKTLRSYEQAQNVIQMDDERKRKMLNSSVRNSI